MRFEIKNLESQKAAHAARGWKNTLHVQPAPRNAIKKVNDIKAVDFYLARITTSGWINFKSAKKKKRVESTSLQIVSGIGLLFIERSS